MQLEELRNFWTKVLGIHGPQWMIVVALQRLDKGEGVAIETIADTLDMNPNFVASQSRLLERKGLIQRKAANDTTADMLLLTEQARRQLAEHDPSLQKS